MIRAQYKDVPVRAQERLEAGLAQPKDAAALGVDPGAPVMLVERTAYAANGRPVEVSRDVFRGDRIRIVWETEIG